MMRGETARIHSLLMISKLTVINPSILSKKQNSEKKFNTGTAKRVHCVHFQLQIQISQLINKILN